MFAEFSVPGHMGLLKTMLMFASRLTTAVPFAGLVPTTETAACVATTDKPSAKAKTRV
jgi:hypothetical protein